MAMQDKFFAAYFAIFLFIALNVDIFGLGLRQWPLPPVKNLIQKYVDYMDPVFGSESLWHKIIILVEVIAYPPYFIAAFISLHKGIENCPWIRVPTIIFTCAIVYSYILIIGYNTFGDQRTPYPLLWIVVYSPFLIVPVWFCLYVHRTIEKSLKVE